MLVRQKQQSETRSVDSLQAIEKAKGIQREPFAQFRETPGTCHTTKVGSPTLDLITHFAAGIMLIPFLNQGCERPPAGFKCHLNTDVA